MHAQGWRLDPLLLFCQLLIAGGALGFAVESLRLRTEVRDMKVTQSSPGVPSATYCCPLPTACPQTCCPCPLHDPFPTWGALRSMLLPLPAACPQSLLLLPAACPQNLSPLPVA
jgi:hypothetical protein